MLFSIKTTGFESNRVSHDKVNLKKIFARLADGINQ